MATSSPTPNLNFYYDTFELAKWIDREKVCYDDGVTPCKPAPDMYLQAACKLGIKPEEMIVVEDSEVGVQAAHRANVGKIIVITPNEHSIFENDDRVHDVIHDYYHFERFL